MTSVPSTPRIAQAMAIACLAFAASAAHAVNLSGSGYAESFDSMGTSGTTPPAGWTVYTGPTGTTNATFTTTIPASGVAALVATAAPLTAITSPTATNNNGYNAAASASATADRVLSTSPTTTSAAGLQLALTNATGSSLSGLTLGYDTVRFTAASTANELPGYWLFYSLDGTSWANVALLNPTIVTVPNTVGVTSTSGSFLFSTPVAAGDTVTLRWVDDNAQQTSPDQILGLNNVSITPVPEQGSLALMLAGLAMVGAGASRHRRGQG